MVDKIKKRKKNWYLGSLFGIILGFGLYFYAPLAEAPLYLLTTNIDIANKKINNHLIKKEEDWSSSLIYLFQYFHDQIKLVALELASVQNIANPKIKIVYVPSGMRKEQIAEKIGQVLNWKPEDKEAFLCAKAPNTDQIEDGYFYPGLYTFNTNTTGLEAANEMINRFQKEVIERYPESTNKLVPLPTALIIASLIEREAANRNDMPLIAGVIWNRIFAGMPLGIDATLQYARGTNSNGWWPKVKTNDKFIESPYNTYKRTGLPPSPIANPNLISLEAALNPIPTNCFYYLHDKNRNFHCARTYEEHKKNIERYLSKK